jgi:mono/diheme cytochrome c family protein
MKRAVILSLFLSTSAWADGDLDRGAVLYQGSCMACHGVNADGNGPAVGPKMNPRPTDFTSAAWWKGRTDQQVAVAIKSPTPGTSMLPFTHLNDQQVSDLVAYLRSKAPVSEGDQPTPGKKP